MNTLKAIGILISLAPLTLFLMFSVVIGGGMILRALPANTVLIVGITLYAVYCFLILRFVCKN
jgi:hypothetical protein